MEEKRKDVYAKDTVEFVTVAVEFCAFLEQSGGRDKADFVTTLLKILPLLYLKASLLPESLSSMMTVEHPVNEDDYEFIRQTVNTVMAEDDDYLEVFVDDMKYSDTPIRKTVSEDMADMYQDLRNFIEVYRQGNEETMQIALAEVTENFQNYWGQILVNTMRALHDVRYNRMADDKNGENGY